MQWGAFMGKFRLIAAAAALLAAVASPAAASVTITTTGSSGTDGTDGNIRTFSSGGITVQASAFSYQGSTLERGFLGAYSTGLGVTNNDEGNGGSSNSHTADNVGQNDFILLIFNQAVNLTSAVLTPYDVGTGNGDNDAWVSYANLAGAFTNTPTPVALNSPLWAALMGNDWTVTGNNNSPFSTNLGSGSNFANVWLIGAANPNPDRYDDGFKLKSITVNTAVPEPGTWAMMLFGFGAVGYSLRRRKPLTIAQIA